MGNNESSNHFGSRRSIGGTYFRIYTGGLNILGGAQANRYQTRELDVPVAMEVLTDEDFKATDRRNLADALRYSQGIIYYSDFI